MSLSISFCDGSVPVVAYSARRPSSSARRSGVIDSGDFIIVSIASSIHLCII